MFYYDTFCHWLDLLVEICTFTPIFTVLFGNREKYQAVVHLSVASIQVHTILIAIKQKQQNKLHLFLFLYRFQYFFEGCCSHYRDAWALLAIFSEDAFDDDGGKSHCTGGGKKLHAQH